MLSALIALKKVGLFARALIKKCCNWLVHCREDAIETHFDGLDVGSMGVVKGKLNGEENSIFCMKEPVIFARSLGQ